MRPQRKHQWPAFALSAFSLIMTSAYAADEAKQDEGKQEEERISVVGSRITVRTEVETAAPVDLISGDELQDQGFTNLGSALESLAPSFNYAEMSVNDGSDHVKPAMLRGLGPDQTLVLINGKRRHSSAMIHQYSLGRGSAGTDFDAIPMSAVKRIEILRDGASAQYGSDAIAGVINIVLKTGTETKISEDYRVTSEGDGDTFKTAINTGFEVGSGSINISAESSKADATNRAATDPHTYGGQRGQWHMGEADFWQNSLFFNAVIPVGETAEFYAFGGSSLRDGAAGGYFRCPQFADDGFDNANDFDDVNPNNNTFCTVIPANQLARYPHGTLPVINSRIKDESLAAGVRFDIGEWRTDASVSTGRNSFAFDVSDSLNFSYGAGPTGNVADIPTSAHAGDLKFGQNIFNFDMNRVLTDIWTLAIGVEARHENYQIKAGDEYSYLNYAADPANTWANDGVKSGIQVFPGWSPDQAADVSRNSKAVYADLAANFAYGSSLEFALREEKYSDFGSNLSAKLAGRWQMADDFGLRGSYSDGFRAPSLAQTAYSQKNSTFEAGVPSTNGIFRIGSDIANSFGIPELKAEKSTGYTLGAVYTPLEGLSITLDTYLIDISDRIGISGNFYGSEDPLVASLLPAGVDAAAFFTNAIDTRTKGADLVIHYRQETGNDGHIDYIMASSYAHTEVTGVNVPPGALAAGNAYTQAAYFDAHERYRTEKYAPRNRDVVSAIATQGDWHFGASATYYGKVTTMYANGSDPSVPDPTYTYVDDGRWILGLNLGVDIQKHISLSAAIDNLADAYPKKQHGPWNGSTFPYSEETSQWGLAGRTYTVNFSYKF